MEVKFQFSCRQESEQGIKARILNIIPYAKGIKIIGRKGEKMLIGFYVNPEAPEVLSEAYNKVSTELQEGSYVLEGTTHNQIPFVCIGGRGFLGYYDHTGMGIYHNSDRCDGVEKLLVMYSKSLIEEVKEIKSNRDAWEKAEAAASAVINDKDVEIEKLVAEIEKLKRKISSRNRIIKRLRK